MDALDILKEQKLDLPFIVVSGAIGEALAVEVMRAGAHDYIMKENMTRLAPAIEREWREAKARRKRHAASDKVAHLAAIVDSTAEAIIGTTTGDVITSWNPAAEQLYGYSENEAIGRHLFLIVPRVMQPEIERLLEKARNSERVTHYETTGLGKDGAMTDIILSLSPIKDAGGGIIGASFIAHDITERKRVEADKKQMYDRLNEALAQVKTLRGMLPICASCKKIRDDDGYWQRVETFIEARSRAEFSHSICPECMQTLYPEFVKNKQEPVLLAR